MTQEAKQTIVDLVGKPASTKQLNALSLIQMHMQDAMFNPLLFNLPYTKESSEAGWGLEKPDQVGISYQRLWEYSVQQDILRDAVAVDIEITGKYPVVDAQYSGQGFEEQLGRIPLNHPVPLNH